MLITARVPHGPARRRGVIGYARSDDLLNWDVQPPLTEPAGFGHLEVPQVAVVDGQPLLLFRTNLIDRSDAAAADQVWAVPGASVTGPWDLRAARPVPCPGLYAPRLVRAGTGSWQLIGLVNEREGVFVGELTDPVPVRYTAADGLRLSGGSGAP
ncbi:hypothetical protein AB5J52_42390 [Streptomyces sp. R39]|uniref:Glycosyl hydrolase family 32 N-terminal domain-containing protein n=1 Tax=Streptomyces sp. R39 TaxID=3238631 RepID=A0AB39R0K7_9ACTN